MISSTGTKQKGSTFFTNSSMEKVKDTIFEEREEEMISTTGDSKSTLREAHFLRPTFDKANQNLPLNPLSLISNNTSVCQAQIFRQIGYCAWRFTNLEWSKWVEAMEIKHQHTWKKCGIYEAVLCSKITIRKDMDLVFGVAEKWCCETNTFVFPWGEATVTLEDMLVLGGFSVSGDSVLAPLEIAEMNKTEKILLRCCNEIRLKTGNYPSPSQWIKYFVSKHDSKVEHEAFLCLWLCKYVFPNTKNVMIDKTVFAAAVRLARGIRLALAPPVLARIYRDLGTLKDRIVHSKTHLLKLCAQLHLVQVWAWERFPSLRPKPHLIKNDDPRLAKWNGLKKLEADNLRLVIDSDGEHFQWRPYVAKKGQPYFGKLYRENEGWEVLNVAGYDMDSAVESFARCVRVSELVGIDCIEQYLPHRVAMQFGLDQEVPDYDVPRFNKNPQIAWRNYIRPVRDEKVFFPSRLFEADVTTRYFDWWRSSKAARQDDALGMPVKRRRRSCLSKFAELASEEHFAALNDDEDHLTISQLKRCCNVKKTHVDVVSPVLEMAHQIPSPSQTRDLDFHEDIVDEPCSGRVTETRVQFEASETVIRDSEVVAVVEDLEAHQTQPSCNMHVTETRVQHETSETVIRDAEVVAVVEDLEAHQTQSSCNTRVTETLMQTEALEEADMQVIKVIEVIDLESLESSEFEDSIGYKEFMKSSKELIARISKIEQIVDKLKEKLRRKLGKQAKSKNQY